MSHDPATPPSNPAEQGPELAPPSEALGVGPAWVSASNRGVALAAPGEFAPLRIGPLAVAIPVVLAPMAGVTNAPFRSLCREYGAGLYVSEMITARPLVEGRAKTLKLADFAPEESPRSLQLYGVDPYYVGQAVARLVGEGRVDHIDMNFGCPVPKVTRKGGGSAIPLHHVLLRNIVRAAVRNAGSVPITIKFRMGVDDDHFTFLTAGRIAQEEGCAAVALHARTAQQLYDGQARWEAIGELKAALDHLPVLGNGDIWEARDALRMMRQTGCDGVVVGRGCLGRPWLFRDLADVFAGRQEAPPPNLGQVADIMRDHARRLVAWVGEEHGCRMFRRHTTWYTKGFAGGNKLRQGLTRILSLADLEVCLADIREGTPFPESALRVARGKSSGQQRVCLPEGWLESREDPTPPSGAAEDLHSGG